MIIETAEDLSNTLADWLGVYGCCKSNGEEGCEFDKEKPFCCRIGFVEEIKERMQKAVGNDFVIALNKLKEK